MRKTKRRAVAPPNLAAKALADYQFRQKRVPDKSRYSRKIKFKQGSATHVPLPFLCLAA